MHIFTAMSETTYIWIAVAAVLSSLVTWLLTKFQFQNTTKVLEERSFQLDKQRETLERELLQEKQLHVQASEEKNALKVELSSTENEVKNLRTKLDEYVNDTNKLQERFENLANKLLEEKTQKFTLQNKDNLKTILDPLKEKITAFEQKIELSNKESIDRHASLRQQIIGLKELNSAMTKEAQNLTRALKGDKKIQGNWGELVLDSVLEKSGLELGREYEKQVSLTNEEGQRKQPDVVINLPDGKKLIVDSKVSLAAYERFVNAEEDEDEQTNLKAHVLAIRNHIKGLSEQNYHDLYQMESPDFVLMFIPIETAFSSAINFEPKIYNEAFDKNIVIVTPSTLLATLKTIDTMWQNEKQKRNTIEIASEAGKMYDKLVLLLKDLEQLGKQMNTSKKSYDLAMNKLVEGSGNMISRAEKMKKLGAKANKAIDKAWVDRANEETKKLDSSTEL